MHATPCPMVCIISRCGSRNTNHLVGTSQLSKAGTPRSSPLLVLSSSVGGVRGGSWEEPSLTVSNGGDPGLPCTVGANKITFAFCSAVFGCVHQIARHKLREKIHCIVRVTKTLKMFTLRFFGGHIDHVHRFHHGRSLLVPLGKTWTWMRSLLLISFRKLFGMRKVLIPSMRKCLVLPST